MESWSISLKVSGLLGDLETLAELGNMEDIIEFG
jgi:hypothetical protein